MSRFDHYAYLVKIGACSIQEVLEAVDTREIREAHNRQIEILEESRTREAALKAKYEAKLKRAAKMVAELKKNQKTDSFLIPPSYCKDNRRFHREAWNISNKSANDNLDHP